MSLPLTDMQARIYSFMINYKARNDGNSPTVREIAKFLKMGSTSIQYQLDNMERVGVLTRRKDGRSRSIQLIGGKYIPPAWGGEM